MEKLLSARQMKCIDLTRELRNIGVPLFNTTHISNYSYCRINQDGSYIFISTHDVWLTQYFLQGFSLTASINECPHILKQKFSMWQELQASTLVDFTLKNFTVDNGITIVEEINNHLEFFHFCTDKNTTGMTSWYLNHFNLLLHFTKYFRDKISPLLTNEVFLPLQQPDALLIKKFITQAHQVKTDAQTYDRLFHNETAIQHADVLLQNKMLTLKKREIQCLEFLVQGYTAKRIAEKLYLSPRTVECYLAGLKKKMRCRTKSDLISTTIDLGLIDH